MQKSIPESCQDLCRAAPSTPQLPVYRSSHSSATMKIFLSTDYRKVATVMECLFTVWNTLILLKLPSISSAQRFDVLVEKLTCL